VPLDPFALLPWLGGTRPSKSKGAPQLEPALSFAVQLLLQQVLTTEVWFNHYHDNGYSNLNNQGQKRQQGKHGPHKQGTRSSSFRTARGKKQKQNKKKIR
jgi:hypothetical protein